MVDPSAAAPPALAARHAAPGIDTATVRSWVNPRGAATTVRHEYGTTTAYGAQTAPAEVGAGAVGVTAEGAITGLQPCTTYHYRTVATSVHGTSIGADRTFWTAGKPTVVDAGALSIKVARTGRRARQVRVPLMCRKRTGRACAGRIQVRTVRRVTTTTRGKRRKQQVTFADFRYRLAAGKSGTATARMSKPTLALLRRLGAVRVSIDAVVTPSSGPRRIVSAKARLTTKRR